MIYSRFGVHPYRIFVCYSHEDHDLVKKMVVHLEGIGFRPVWDKNIKAGQRFSDVIKRGIAHAHVFMPLLTRSSVKRPWVHQETGYAMGLEVPVLPVAVGRVPGEMIQQLHALTIREDLQDLKPDVLVDAVEDLLACERPGSEVTFRCAALPEQRADLLGRYTREALTEGAHGRLRQSGALTSFNLPVESPNHEIWRLRDEPVHRGDLLHNFLYEEREALEAYARKHGCDLIIDPSAPLPGYSATARRIRLRTLLEFLEDTKVKDVRVAIRQRTGAGNLTVVGDWFSAESIAPRPGKGYYQTIFTWHAPSVLATLRKFDHEFNMLLEKAGLTDDSSGGAAISAVKQAIDEIKD